MLKKSTSRASDSRRNGRARNLDHGADLHFIVERDTRAASSSLLHSSSTSSARRNSSNPEIIGNIILTLPELAGAQDGAQLRLENFEMLKAKPDRATTRKGFISSLTSTAAGDFVAAKIERSNDERMRSRPVRRPADMFRIALPRRAG